MSGFAANGDFLAVFLQMAICKSSAGQGGKGKESRAVDEISAPVSVV